MRAFLSRLSAPPKLTLLTHQPTPSTVKYTVTTRPAPSLVARLCRSVSILLRGLVGICVALFVYLKWSVRASGLSTLPPRLLDLGLESFNKTYVAPCEYAYVLPAAVAISWLVCRRGYTEESLTVLRGLGIQTSTTSSTYLLSATKRFIPTTSIQDIVIHEAFKGFEVRFYLAIIVEGEGDVVVVFDKLLPRRAVLEEVWRGGRKCLWEGRERSNVKQ